MSWPFLSPTVSFNVNSSFGSASTSGTTIDATNPVWLCGCDLVNSDTGNTQTYRLYDNSTQDLLPSIVLPPGGTVPCVPSMLSFLRPCNGLKEIASSALVKRHVWGYK